jgi:hypothetical protein
MVGYKLSEKRVDRYHVRVSTLNDVDFTGLLAYLISGRIFYATEHINAFIQSPISLISLNVNLFDNWEH